MTKDLSSASIVVGVDGSEDSDRALHWAAEHAHREGRPLVVLTAVGVSGSGAAAQAITMPGMGALYVPNPEDLLDAGKVIASDAAATARRLRPELEVGTLATWGDPREVMVDLSSRVHLLVLGSRGRGAVRSKLLGSVSASIARQAACPVVVCRPAGRRRSDAGVLVGADGTAESVPVIELAFRLASSRDLPLTVLHCMWDAVAAVHGPSVVPATESGLDEQRMLLSEAVAGLREKFPDVPVQLQLARGVAEECLAADSARWDLIVVGRHPVDTIPRLVAGSTATSVLEHAHTTVVVVPESTSGVSTSSTTGEGSTSRVSTSSTTGEGSTSGVSTSSTTGGSTSGVSTSSTTGGSTSGGSTTGEGS